MGFVWLEGQQHVRYMHLKCLFRDLPVLLFLDAYESLRGKSQPARQSPIQGSQI